MKTTSAIPTEIKKLGKIFEQAGHEIRIVGGWVRDTMSGNTPKDLDLATTATPLQMGEICVNNGLSMVPTGIDHGTVTIVFPRKRIIKSGLGPDIVPAYEVTTLRVDKDTDGRHATVEYTADWKLDAARRDFTINAMSMGLDGKLYDYFGGQEDLKANRIVFVGDADARIKEDFLRILRYFRFRSRVDDRIHDRETLAAIKANAMGLRQISVERIWMEMAKILKENSTMICLCMIDMLETDVLEAIGLSDVGRYDIVNGTITRRWTDNPVTVLAAMTSAPIGSQWKMTQQESSLLGFLQPWRLKQRPELAEFKAIAVRHNLERAIELACLFGPSEILEALREWEVPVLPVRGQDLVDIGYEPGPEVGQIIRRLANLWQESDYVLGKEALMAKI